MFLIILMILAIAATLTGTIGLTSSTSDSVSDKPADIAERPRQDDWGICTELVAVRQLTSSPETNKPRHLRSGATHGETDIMLNQKEVLC